MLARGANRLARAARALTASGAPPPPGARHLGLGLPSASAGECLGTIVAPARRGLPLARGAFRRGCASEAGGAPAAERPTVISHVVDTLQTVGTVLGLGVGATVGASMYLQTTDELEKTVEAGDHVPGALRATPLEPPIEYAARNLLEFRKWMDDQAHNYLDPVSDKLLPDHPPNLQYVPHTLVLDLDDTLILSDWTRERGWRVFKRPGAEDFLKHMAQFYEVVVFSDQLATYVDPIAERLDPAHVAVQARLYREATQYKNGHYLRDFTKLNREIGKVIYVTARPKNAIQQENCVVINPYRIRDEGGGEGGNRRVDTTLLDLMPFLESIVRLNVQDVREVLESYKKEQESTGKSIPDIFRERQVRFQQSQRRRNSGKSGFSRGYESFRSAKSTK